MYGPGKYWICREEEKEMEKNDNIWRREMVSSWRRRLTKKENEQLFLEKENIWFTEETKNGEKEK